MNNKKNSILFVEYCPNLKGGGAQRVFLDILRSIDQERFNVLAAFPKAANGDLETEIPQSITSLHYDSKSPTGTGKRWLEYLRFLINIPLIVLAWYFPIKRHRIEIIYVHSLITGLHFGLLKFLCGYKLIYHEHNMASQRPNTLVWQWMFRFVMKQADSVIAISKDVAADLVASGADQKKSA